jgi:hypothetical protein
MDTPTSEVGYTAATTRMEATTCGGIGKKLGVMLVLNLLFNIFTCRKNLCAHQISTWMRAGACGVYLSKRKILVFFFSII